MDTQGQVNQAVAQAQSQGAALQNQYNQQSSQLQGQYGQAQGDAQGAYNDLKSYTDSMQDPGQLYNQYLTQAQQQYGFNPADLKTSLQNVATTNTTLANEPQAVQSQGNYYGTTAGSEANNYAAQAGNLQGLLTGQTNNANVYQQLLGATQNQANQQATLSGQFEQTKSGALGSLYQNATAQMQSSGQTMASIEALQQQQGYLTSEQVAQYQGAYNGYLSAQAAQTAAQGQLMQGEASKETADQQVQQLQQIQSAFKSLYGGQWQTALAQALTGQGITASKVGGTNSGALQVLSGGGGLLSGLQGSSGAGLQ